MKAALRQCGEAACQEMPLLSRQIPRDSEGSQMANRARQIELQEVVDLSVVSAWCHGMPFKDASESL